MMALSTSSTAPSSFQLLTLLPAPPPTPARVSVEFQAVLADLVKLLDLKDGWDSYRAPRPTTKALAGAVIIAALADEKHPHLLESLEFAPFLDGGVVLTIAHGDKCAEFTVNNRASVRVEFHDVDEEASLTADAPSAMQKVKRALAWLAA